MKTPWFIGAVLSGALCGLAACTARAGETPPSPATKIADVADQLQLFLDDTLIESMKGAELRLQHPQPAEIAIRKDKPWEDNAMFDPVVIKDGAKYRMWYRGGAGDSGVTFGWATGYAESDDGVVWTKPSLGLVEFNKSKENNIVCYDSKDKDITTLNGLNTLSIIKDTNPQCKEAERYKAISCGNGNNDKVIVGLVSPDGIHWQFQAPNPLVKGGPFDSHNILIRDEARNQYAIYARAWTRPHGRFVQRFVSPDFQNWSKREGIDVGNATPEQLYKNGATPYYRRPDIVLMFPKRFMEGRGNYEPGAVKGLSQAHNSFSDIVFMFSYDGLHFDRRHMEAFIRPGPDPSNWHARAIYTGTTLVPTGNGELSMYMAENYSTPTAHIRRMVLRVDGFVSLHAGCPSGEMMTKPFTFKGNALQLNYATSAAGSIQIEVQDESGKALPGFALADAVEIFGDEIERKAAWKGNPDLGKIADQPVRLRFVMKDADLYSIRFVPK